MQQQLPLQPAPAAAAAPAGPSASAHAAAAAPAAAIDAAGARAAIKADFARRFGAPGNKVAADVTSAYIEELVAAVQQTGQPHTDKQIDRLKRLVDGTLLALKRITTQSLTGLEGGSTGPSPADDQVGLYKDFKQFIRARAAGGVQSEDRQKILYLEAQVSELQGYLQSNSTDRIRLIAKIRTRFLKDANGPEAMKARKRAWGAKITDVTKLEGLLEDTRIKLGRARVAEAMLREKVQHDREMLATMEKQEDAAQKEAEAAAKAKYDAQKKRAEEKDALARTRLNIAKDITYKGNHNHAAVAAPPKKKRRNMFVDDEAKEGDEDEDMSDYE